MIRTIAAKELRALFSAPTAWTVLGFLQLVIAWVFLARLDSYLENQSQFARFPTPPGLTEVIVAPVFSAAAIVLLMAVPMLSMRMIAEERRNQTLSLLVSAPVTMTQIVLGKFIGLTAFLAVYVLIVAAVCASLLVGGPLDGGLFAANALGLLLVCACFAAVGLFMSSLTAQPATAAITTLAVLLGSWLINIGATDANSPTHLLSIVRHFEGFNKGLLDTGDVAWFVLVTAAFLALAVRRLDRDRLGA